MKITAKQKEIIEKRIKEIASMGLDEVQIFAQKWYMAKEDLGENVFKWVQKALDVHIMQLQDNTTSHAMIVLSELREGERE